MHTHILSHTQLLQLAKIPSPSEFPHKRSLSPSDSRESTAESSVYVRHGHAISIVSGIRMGFILVFFPSKDNI